MADVARDNVDNVADQYQEEEEEEDLNEDTANEEEDGMTLQDNNNNKDKDDDEAGRDEEEMDKGSDSDEKAPRDMGDVACEETLGVNGVEEHGGEDKKEKQKTEEEDDILSHTQDNVSDVTLKKEV